ncbi:MAG: hypothetical protein U9N30_04350 [Campylobacterota bacterium]|nr:hypothetical protein [Campylobacterota bacterium]
MFKIAFYLLVSLLILDAKQNCIQCHPSEAKKCETSKHTTLKNAINITREIWGIKNSDVTLQTIPHSPLKIKKPADLVDDFLRRKCLKCHLGVKSSGELGMRRQKNCLACHSKHNDKGKCQTQKIDMNKCLSCHNKQFVGTDYLGLFPKDHHHSFRAPLQKDGKYPSQKYGIDHHALNQDIHYAKGMSCVDCHNNNDGKNWETGAKCVECHSNLSQENHQDDHKNISCSACHSSWNMSSYELSVFRDDMADYEKWKELRLQEDGYLTKFLNKALKSEKVLKPVMPDWVDRKLKKGIWYSGYRYKRWEHFVLGNNDKGKIEILRPMFQYRISYRDKNGKMILDDVSQIDGKAIEAWVPYAPHTIVKKAKSCEQCHENPLQNPTLSDNVILDLMKPKNIVHGSPLTKKQLNKLNSQKYKKIRANLLFD